MPTELSSLLANVSCPALEDLALLRDFGIEERQALVNAGSSVFIPQKSEVIAEGSSHETLFVVLSGRFLVERHGVIVAELGVGQVCGEMEMLNPPQASASVRALTDATIWRITRTQFRRFLEASPQAGNRFMRLITETFAARLSEDQIQ